MNQRPSLTTRIQKIDLNQPILSCGFFGKTPFHLTNFGELHLGLNQEAIHLHEGIVLSQVFENNSLTTSGDDGKIIASNGEKPICKLHEKNKWIDNIAVKGQDFAYSIGKNVTFVPAKGNPKTFSFPSTPGGIAFAPKGTRLAVAHYNGVSLWFPNLETSQPEQLVWHGSHLDVMFSPDNQFLITSMQEPQLHGWRLSDKKDMRMSGYPLKVRSMNFTKNGNYLATSGAQEAILWPFSGKNGPMGEKPLMIAGAADKDGFVNQVASHPLSPVVAVGFNDGMILMARLPDGAEVLIRAATKDAITALEWRADGKALSYGTESGEAGYLEI